MSVKPHSPVSTPERWVLLALLLATFLKVAWALTSAGSADAILFYEFAKNTDQIGLNAMYVVDPRFNHTPFTGCLNVALFALTGGDYQSFSFVFRLMGIVADVAVVLGLLQMRRVVGNPVAWALALFAASPVSLMISGFHGNVDPLMIALMFFAAIACLNQRALLCGVFFGLACNIKIVPILFAPVFFFFWLHRGNAWRFVLPAGALMVGGLSLPLLQVPGAYLQNVFGYGSLWGVWGVSYWLRQSGWDEVQRLGYIGLSPIQTKIATGLKLGIVLGISALAWRRRSLRPEAVFATLAGAWMIFFALVPGVGTQYMVWFAPFVLLLSARWFVALTATSTLFCGVFYHLCSPKQFPWFVAIPKPEDVAVGCAVANITWLAIIALMAAKWRELWTIPASETTATAPRETSLERQEELLLPGTMSAGAAS
jgi:hypothetical protein